MRRNVGENIKKIREKMGLNQQNIADYLGVDQSLISKIETANRGLSSDMLDRLAKLFGMTVESIENGMIDELNFSFAFRASKLSTQDLETISNINRIALNINFMNKILKGEKR